MDARAIFWIPIAFICLIIGITISTNQVTNKVDEYDINNKCDSLIIENANLKNDIIKINLYVDSVETIKDSINNKLFIANFKLERIKKYNQIAAKGNNIKYLRGWINRVINE